MTDPLVADGPDQPAGTIAETQNLTQDELMRIIQATMPVAVVGLAVLALLYTMYFAADLILPVFLAQFLSIVLRPMVRGLTSFGIPRAVGAVLVLMALIGAIISGLINLSAPVETWMHRLPSIQRDIETKLWPVTESIKQAKKATASIEQLTNDATTTVKKSEVTIKQPTYLSRAFASTLLTSVQLLIVLALAFFFLTQRNEKTQLPFSKIPWLKHSGLISDIFASVQETITRFLQISAGIYSMLGIVTALAMYLLGMPNPVLWGILAAVLGFIPYVGPMIVFFCIGTVSLLTFDIWWQIIAPPLAYGILTIIEGNFVTPAILGRQLKLNPIAVFMSMLLWTWVWGVAGAILAVPILVIIVIVSRHLALMVRESDDDATDTEQAANP